MPDKDDMGSDIDEVFNEADFFDDLDMGEPDTESRTPAEKRSEMVTGALFSGGKGFSKSVAAEINNALPRTNALKGEGMIVVNEFKALNQNFQKELAPTLNSVKRAMAKSLPMAQKFIPPKIYNAIENQVKDFTDEHRTPSKAQQQTEDIAANIGNIFAQQEGIRSAERVESRTTQLVDRVLEGSRADRQQDALVNITNQLLYQNSFIASTQTAWMKKMLELKYIGVYTAKEQLSVSKILAQITEKKLEEIKHNTALPDFIKTRKTDALRGNIRGRAINKFGDFAQNYVQNTTKNLGKVLKNQGTNFLSQVRDGANMASSAAEMAAAGQEMEEATGGPDDSGGNAGVNIGSGLIGKFFGTNIGRRTAGVLAPALNKVEGSAGTAKADIAFMAKRAKDRLEGGGGFMQLLGALLPEFSNDTTLTNDVLDDPEGATSFDNMTRHTIVEIIPGFLSRMTKHLNDLVNGEDNERLVYDVVKGGFGAESDVRESVVSRILGDKESRSQELLQTLGTVRGSAIDIHGEEVAADFDMVSRDIIRFITNSAINIAPLDPEAIRAFSELNTDDTSLGGSYIEKNFDGVEFPKETAMMLTASMFRDGVLEPAAFKQIKDIFMRSVQSENWKEMLPKLMKGAGQQDLLGEFLKDDQSVDRAALVSEMLNISPDRMKNEVNTASDNFASELSRRRVRDEEFKDTADRFTPERLKDAAGNFRRKTSGLVSELAGLFDGEDVASFTEDKFGFTDEQRAAFAAAKAKGASGLSSMANSANSLARRSAEGLSGSASDIRDHFAEFTEANEATSIAKITASDVESGSVMDEKSTLAQNVRLIGFSDAIGTKCDMFTKNITELLTKVISPEARDLAERDPTKPPPLPGKDEATGSQFHQDMLAFSAANSTENALIIDALLSKGKNSKSILRGAGGALSKMWDGYTSIYTQLIKTTGEVVGTGLEHGIPMLGKLGTGAMSLAGKLGGSALDMYSNIYGKGIEATGNVISSMFGGKGKAQWVDIYRKDKIDPGFPLLTVRQQKEDIVFADQSRPKASADFDGQPAIDVNTGTTLITSDDIAIGLVDIHGNDIGGGDAKKSGLVDKALKGVSGIFKGGKDLLTGAMGMYGKIYSKIFEKAADGIGGLFNWATGGKKKGDMTEVVARLDTLIKMFGGGSANENFIARIHDILDVRMPGKLDDEDVDGDGDRDGSYRDQVSQIAGGKKDKKFKPGMKGPSGGMINKNGDEVDKDGNILETAANLALVGQTLKGKGSKLARLHKVGKAGKLGKFGMKGRAAAKVYKGAGAAKAGIGRLALRGGLAAATGASLLAGTSAGAAVVSGGAAVGGAAAGAGTAIVAGLAAIPVAGWIALGVLAIGAAGWGIWNATRDREGGTKLAEMRVKAYGLSKDFDVTELEDFEEDMADVIVDGDELDLEDFTGDNLFSTNWMGMFGLDKEDPEQLKYFGTWMARRALPTFAIVHGVTKGHDVDYNSLNSLKETDPKYPLIQMDLEANFKGIDKTLIMSPEGYLEAKALKEQRRAADDASRDNSRQGDAEFFAKLYGTTVEEELAKASTREELAKEGELSEKDTSEKSFFGKMAGAAKFSMGFTPLGMTLKALNLAGFFPFAKDKQQLSELFAIRASVYNLKSASKQAIMDFENVAADILAPSFLMKFFSSEKEITSGDIYELGLALGIDMRDRKANMNLTKWVKKRFTPIFNAYLAVVTASGFTHEEMSDPDVDTTDIKYKEIKAILEKRLPRLSMNLPDISPLIEAKSEPKKPSGLGKGAGGITPEKFDAMTSPDGPKKSNVDNYAPSTGVKELDKDITRGKHNAASAAVAADVKGPDESLQVQKALLAATEKNNTLLVRVADGTDKVGNNTGALGDIKKGLDDNLAEATKPTQAITQIVQPATSTKVSKPTLNVAKA